MQHNLQQYCTQLFCVPSYCANPVFLSGISWEVENSSHVLVDKANDANTITCVVGHVLDHCLFVTPNRNYSTDQFGDFSTSKFLFVIGKPDNTPFADNFSKALEVVGKIQNQITLTPNCINFITTTRQTKMLCFTHNIFEKG
jgi:hypothetical protein